MGDIALGFADGIRQSGVGNLYERASDFQKQYVDMANATAQTQLNAENLRLARENATLDRAFREKEFNASEARQAKQDVRLDAAESRTAATHARDAQTAARIEKWSIEDRPRAIEAMNFEITSKKVEVERARLAVKAAQDALDAAPEDRRLQREAQMAQTRASNATTAAQEVQTKYTLQQMSLADAAYAEAGLTKPGSVARTLLTNNAVDLTVLDPATRAAQKSSRIATQLALMQTSMTDAERTQGAAKLAKQVEQAVEQEMLSEQGFAWFLWNTSHDALKPAGAGAAQLATQISPQALQDFIKHQAQTYVNNGSSMEDKLLRQAAVARVLQTNDSALGPTGGAAGGMRAATTAATRKVPMHSRPLAERLADAATGALPGVGVLPSSIRPDPDASQSSWITDLLPNLPVSTTRYFRR